MCNDLQYAKLAHDALYEIISLLISEWQFHWILVRHTPKYERLKMVPSVVDYKDQRVCCQFQRSKGTKK